MSLNRILFTTIIFFCTVCAALAQTKSTLAQLSIEALRGDHQSVFTGGVGISGTVFGPLSPSFKIGGSGGFQVIGLEDRPDSYHAFSLHFGAMYQPEMLLRSITGKGKIAPGLYLKAEIGNQFDSGYLIGNTFLNSGLLAAGWLIPVKQNAVHVQLSFYSYPLVRYSAASASNANAIGITVGYSWIKPVKNKN